MNKRGKPRKPPASSDPQEMAGFGTLTPSFGSDNSPLPDTGQPGGPRASGTLTPEMITVPSQTGTAPVSQAAGTLVAPPPGSIAATAPALPSPQVHRTVFHTHQGTETSLTEIAAEQQKSPERPYLAADSAETRILPPGAIPKPAAGKSTWHLQIHRRDVAGDLSGIINEIPVRSPDLTGLQSALAIDEDSPEYEVLGKLGAGNMGIVYRAKQTSLNRDLAVKTLKPDSKNVEHDQAMFVSEAVVTANLVHPNIVPIHDLGRTSDGKLFYSMKQVEGTAWNKTVRDQTLEANLEIFMKLCDAVAYAHSRGVINRDLKPENVIVGDYGEVIVLDWGLAITTDKFPRKDSVEVDFRGGAGTPVYMAPELAGEDISEIGPYSDIYVLGAILFEVIEGFPPHLLREFWTMHDPLEQLNAVIWAVVNNRIEKRISHPGELMNIARKALSTNPEDRYSSVEALQEAIREYRITGRAEELMQAADEDAQNAGYSEYQNAVALYDEALRKWPDNRRAREGDVKARLAYAALAHQKGDIDLGLQVVGEHGNPQFQDVRKKLKKTRLARTVLKATWALLFVAAIAGAFVSTERMMAANRANQQLVEADARLNDVDSALDDATIKLADAEQAKAGALEQQAEAQKLAEEAVSLKVDAETALAETKQAESQARQRAADAEQEAVAAVQARAEAEVARQQALDQVEPLRRESEKLQKQVTEAEALIASAEKRVADALDKAASVEWDSLDATVNAYRDLGRFGKAIESIDGALENESLNAQKRRHLQRWRQQIQADQSQTTLSTGVSQSVISSVSSDGEVVASASRNTVTIQNRHTDPPLTSVVDAGNRIYSLALTRDGNRLAIGGREGLTELWDVSDAAPKKIVLPEAESRSKVAFRHAMFSGSEERVYFVGDNGEATIRIFAVGMPAPQLVYSGSLAGASRSSASYTVRNVLLLQDESALIVNSETEGIFSIPLDFSEIGPLQVSAGSAPGLEGLEGNESTPAAMFLSPDGSLLAMALTSPNRLMILPSDPQAMPTEFPFVAPNNLTDRKAAVLQLGRFEISSVAFSDDSNRLLLGCAKKNLPFIQVWDRTGNGFRQSAQPGLWTFAGTLGSLLAGHGDAVRHVSFAGASSDRVVSVSNDGSTVRSWSISNYGDYVKYFDSLIEVLEAARAAPGKDGNPGDETSSVGKPPGPRRHYIPVSTHQIEASTTQQPSTPFRIGSSPGVPNFIATYSARFNSDGTRVVVGANDRAAHVYKTSTGEKTISMSMGGRNSLFFDPDTNVFLEGHIPNLQSLRVLPPDGSRLLTSDWSGSISVWDASDDEDGFGREVSRLLPENSQSEIAVSEDGTLIFAAGLRTDTDPATRETHSAHIGLLWKLSTIESSPTPDPDLEFAGEHPVDEITAVAISPSGNRVATAGRRGRIVVWSTRDASVIARARNTHNRDGVSGIAFSSDDELISGGYDGRIRRWNIVEADVLPAESQFERRQIEGEPGTDDYVLSLRMNPDGRRFATTSLKQIRGTGSAKETYLFRVTIWSVFSELPIHELRSTSIPADKRGGAFEQGVSWSPDGSRLLFVSNQEETQTTAATEIFVYDTDSWKVLNRLRQSVTGQQHQLSSRDQRRFNAPAIQAAFVPGHQPPNQIATFDGRAAHLWDLASGEHLAEFRAHAAVLGVSFSSDRKYLATASESLRIFDADEDSPNHAATVFRIQRPHQGRIDGVAFSPAPGDYRIASVAATGEIKLWDWKPYTMPPSTAAITIGPPVADAGDMDIEVQTASSVKISPDGTVLLGTQHGRLGLWNITGDHEQSVPVDLTIDGTPLFNAAAFSLDGQRVAAGGVLVSDDGNVESIAVVFQRENEQLRTVAILRGGHATERGVEQQLQGVTAIAFGPTEETLLTGGADGRLLEWIYTDNGPDAEPYEGESAIELRIANRAPHSRAVSGLDVSSKGDIVTSGLDGFIAVWPR